MKRFDLFFYASFVVIVCFLSWKVYGYKKIIAHLTGHIESLEHTHNSLMVNAQIPDNQKFFCGMRIPQFSLPYIDRNNSKLRFSFPEPANNSFYLFIFFTPWDCLPCFEEVPFWNELKTNFNNRLKVVGISTATSREVLRHFTVQNGISIPTLFDEGNILFTKLGLANSGITPIKILTTSKGIILQAGLTTRNDSNRQAEYLKLLEDIIP